MLIIFSLIVSIMIGVLLLLLYKHYHYRNDWFQIIGMTITTVGIISLIVCSICISSIPINSDLNYENMLAQKEMLEYCLEKKSNIVGNELLYYQILEFNNELRSIKKWANNPWTNWFNDQKIADIDYIKFKRILD